MKITSSIREKSDELEYKIGHIINDFINEMGECKIEISVNNLYGPSTTSLSGEKRINTSVKIKIEI